MREEADAGQERAAPLPVAAPEELIAAADGEERRAAVDRIPDRIRPSGEVGGDQLLLAILATADVEEIVRAGLQLVPDRHPLDDEVVAAERGSPRQHGDVAAVGVDVQVLRIEVADPDRGHAASQYGRTSPRSTAIARSCSIAV